MKSITETIKPIQLKVGSHADTGQTGSGCFMNVIAYLNGEPQITDESPCVHPVIRRFMIRINDDFVPHGMGPDLIPFIHRAMGTQYMDGQQLAYKFADAAVRRFAPIVLRAKGQHEQATTLEALPPVLDGSSARAAASAASASAAAYAAYAAASAAYAAAYASDAADAAAAYAADAAASAAAYAADAAASAARADIKAAIIQTLDEILPPGDEQELAVLERAKSLVELAA